MRIVWRSTGLLLSVLLVVSTVGVGPVRADPNPDLPPPGGALPYSLMPLQPSPSRVSLMATTATQPDQIITDPLLDMKVMVVLDDDGGAEGVNQMVLGYLDILSVPYDTYDVNGRDPNDTDPTVFVESDLWDGVRHGHYYAIFITTNGVWDPWSTTDGLNQAERNLIDSYERNFNVRRVTWYAFPDQTTYGMVDVTSTTPYTYTDAFTATLTPAGTGIFNYLRSDVELALDGIYAFHAEPAPVSGASLEPLLVDDQGKTLLAIHTRTDGREQLVMTLSGYYPVNPPLSIHARTLPYGIINWATRGIFLGERHLYFTPQPDDVLYPGDRWDTETHTNTPNTFRLEPEDFDDLILWMADFTSRPEATGFQIELPFNGHGTIDELDAGGNPLSGTLTAKAKEVEAQFVWLNHTYEHLNLDGASYEVAHGDIVSNTEVAEILGFSDYTTRTLLTGEYSGLGTNPAEINRNVINAAYDAGVRYIQTNASYPDYKNPSPNTGFTDTVYADLLYVPRLANNIFYSATTPEEEQDFYHWLYCTPGEREYSPDYCRDTYTETLDVITNQALGFLLDFNVDATMFHMNNLYNYERDSGGNRSLMGDFVESLYDKYAALYDNTIPILSLRTQEIGAKMWERIDYNASGIQGVIACGNTITLTTTNAARIPLTGIDYTGAAYTETYAYQDISYFDMGSGDTVVVPGTPAVTAAKPTGLTVTDGTTGRDISWNAVTTDTTGAPMEILTYVVYRDGVEIGRTTDTQLNDPTGDVQDVYAVTAIGNNCWKRESEPATLIPTAVTLTGFNTQAGEFVPARWLPFLTQGVVVSLLVAAGVTLRREQMRRRREGSA
ncbi:MAG: hypothetical protein ACP5HM_16315 [Anaerolineae bacterium]